MKLIIGIPDEVIETRKYDLFFGVGSTKLTEIIENGIPYEPKGDLISREALKKVLCEKYEVREHYIGEKMLEAIDNAPVVEEKSQSDWIPVSERLPEFTGLYLISIDNLVTALSFDGTGFMNRGGVRIEVDAWMSLPKSYKKAVQNEQ